MLRKMTLRQKKWFSYKKKIYIYIYQAKGIIC